MLRILCLCVLTWSLAAAAETIDRDSLFGFWVVDEKAVTKDQKDAAAQAAKIESFGCSLAARNARFIFEDGTFVAGIWRLDDIKDNTGVIVVQTKSGEEHRYHVTKEKNHLIIKECPGQLKLKNAR